MSQNTIQATTNNITKNINNTAQQKNVPYSLVDFNITSVKTIIINDAKNDAEIEINEIDSFVSKNTHIKQIFSIDMFVSKKRRFIIKSKIFLSKDKSKAYIKIFKNSKIPYTPTLEQDFTQYINKEKAKYNILVGAQEGSMIEEISTFMQTLQENKSITEDINIEIANSSSYIPSNSGYIKYLYLDEKLQKDIDRCYIYVKENEQILDVFLGENGQDGFDVLGNFKPCKKIQKIDTNRLSMSDNIQQKLENNHITAHAKTSGILTYKNNLFDISKELNLNGIEFKDCVYFYSPIDDESIELNIRKTHMEKDAVGANITLIAHKITINGDIGANVNIQAHIINLTGTSHKTSKLKATRIQANTVKGEAEGDYIQVINAEHAKLQGGEVHIDNAIGGNIHGKDVFIKRLKNYSVIKASNIIEIKSLFGRYNDFFLTSIADKDIKQKIQKIKEDTTSHKNQYTPEQIRELQHRFKAYAKKGKNTIAKIKTMQQQQKEILPLTTILYNVKNKLTHIKSVLSKHKQYKENINKLAEYDNCIYNASVTLHDEWKNDNLIVFSKVSDSRQISFEPRGKLEKICLRSNNINDTVLLMRD